jgi:CHAT domain-containing protein
VDGPTAEEIRQARDELDQVIGEIRDVPGFSDFLATPTIQDVQQAARADPLVYLAAAAPGGLALVVRGDDVVHVPLDRMTADAVATQVTAFLEAHAAYRDDPPRGLAAWDETLSQTSQWLWDDVMGPVTAELSGAAGAVLIAGGLLGLLPLHAASTRDEQAVTGRRYLLDELAVSYVPNARALAAARAVAELQPARHLVTVTDPPRPDSLRPLPLAPVEAAAALAAFAGSAELIAGPAATAGAVRAALENADVAHFACHGIAELDSPLDSRILLAGPDDLRLRDLLAMRLHLRLAVLSACETSAPGTDLPDEVVSLPTGLLQAGVGGIVASMWAVPDRPTAMLMTEFYRGWRWDRLTPAAALRRAQRWLRDTTNGEKAEMYSRALAEGAGWLPERAEDDFVTPLLFQDAAGREQDLLSAWAGFAYVGA